MYILSVIKMYNKRQCPYNKLKNDSTNFDKSLRDS